MARRLPGNVISLAIMRRLIFTLFLTPSWRLLGFPRQPGGFLFGWRMAWRQCLNGWRNGGLARLGPDLRGIRWLRLASTFSSLMPRRSGILVMSLWCLRKLLLRRPAPGCAASVLPGDRIGSLKQISGSHQPTFSVLFAGNPVVYFPSKRPNLICL